MGKPEPTRRLFVTVAERADDRVRVDVEEEGGSTTLSFIVDEVVYKDTRPRRRKKPELRKEESE